MRRLGAVAAALLCCTGITATSSAFAVPADTTTTHQSVRTASEVSGDEVEITIDSMGSTYLERRRPVQMKAVVTNTTNHEWSNMKAYLVMSETPLTDRASVEAAAESPAEQYSGSRITKPFSTITEIGRLGVGESKRFTIRVPYRQLDITPTNGVYQVGIHIIATDEEGNRDPNNAIGRARTFMPYLDARTASRDPIEISMVWPFTTEIRRAADGTYPNAGRLIDDIAGDGRLGRMLDAAREAPSRTITVLLDPALIDALSAIARDTYGPPDAENPPGPVQSDPSGTPQSPQEAAADYLTQLRSLANEQDVWMTPYARPDLDALASHPGRAKAVDVYKASERAGRGVLKRFGVTGRIAYMPSGGVADLESLQWAQANTDTSDPSTAGPASILAPEMLEGWSESDPPLISLDAGESTIPTVVDDGVVMAGGPLPGQTDSALQVRQRLASEAAIRAIERTVDPETSEDVVVVVDPAWDPGPGSRDVDLFDVMSATWVTAVSPDRQLEADSPTWQGPVGVPGDETDDPLPSGQVDSAARIVRATRDLVSLLSGGEELRNYYAASAAMVVSQYWRSDTLQADTYATEAVSAATEHVGKVTIEGPGFVSFSGNSGPIPITIHNGLDEPITVGVAIRAQSDDISVPNLEPKEIAPGQSPSFTVDADIGEVSNTAFTATLVTKDGDTFGEPAQFNVRSSVVGTAIWIVMGIAGVLVLIALVRQVKKRRATHPAPDEAEL